MYEGAISLKICRYSLTRAQSLFFVPLASRAEQKERLQAARDNPESLRLVVDLHWAETASGKELSSLVKQLCYVYGRARASLTPPRLTLTSYQGRAAAALRMYVRTTEEGVQKGLIVLGRFSWQPRGPLTPFAGNHGFSFRNACARQNVGGV